MAKLLVRPQAMEVDLVNTSTNTIVFINVKATTRQSATPWRGPKEASVFAVGGLLQCTTCHTTATKLVHADL